MLSPQSLYAAKPWFSDRLARPRRALVAYRVPPAALTAAGVACGALAGLVLATVPAGLVGGGLVALLLTARLACANLDGAVARETGRASTTGAVANEVGDRAAELATLVGVLALAHPALVATAALATSAPSWVSLAGAAAGGPRLQDGPFGKVERCLVLVLVAATGWAGPLLAGLAIGALLTAAVRWYRLRKVLQKVPS